MKNIAIFASGSGSNAENIFNYFKGSNIATISLILSNNPNAYVLSRAKNMGVKAITLSRDQFYGTNEIVEILKNHDIDYIVLAGFLLLVPENLIKSFEGRIINVHPALLPKFGGKGMYGDRVHRAVVEAGECESGITIHKVNEVYDSGAIIAQFKTEVLPMDTPEDVAAKVHALEYKYFPQVIEEQVKLL